MREDMRVPQPIKRTGATARRRSHALPRQPEPAVVPAIPRWLLLVHQLPATPSNLRVRTWRRLQQIGAVAVKQAVYALPDSPTAREDFEWLKTEIEAAGGQAGVFAANTIDTWSSDELVEEFRRAREGDYLALSRAVERALAAARRKRAPRRSRHASSRIVDTFRQRLDAIEAIDFFRSAGRDRVGLLLSELQQALSATGRVHAPSIVADGTRRSFSGRLWVTRLRPGIDRIGSAWLIKRFIDPEARFGFVEEAPAAGDAVPFDMFGVEFTHRGDSCTFETLMQVFALNDPAVSRLATIVHDLDLKDGRYEAIEAAAVGALVDGFRDLYTDDHLLLEQGMTMFEALYRAFAHADRRLGPRSVARQSKTPRRTKPRS
jgi:hypothetical protein